MRGRQITGAAANAFLKTLEEPPAHTKFILATTDPEELLQTIVSRCQRFDFRRINLDAMVANLTRVAKAENIEIDDEAKVAIARHATGSMRDALGLLDQVAVYRENVDDDNTRVTLDLVRTVLGVSRNDRVESIVAALADRDAGSGVRAIGEAVEAGDDMRQLARQLLSYLRLLLLERAGGQTELDDPGKALASRFELGELALLTQRMGDIDFKVKHATISQLPLEIAVVEGALRGQQQTAAQTTQPVSQAPQPPQSNHYVEPQVQQEPASQRQGGSLLNRVRGGGRPDTPQQAVPQRPASQRPQSQPQSQSQIPDQRPQSAPPAPPAAAPAQPAYVPPVMASSEGGAIAVDVLAEGWPRIRADVKAVSRRIEAILQQIDPVAVNGNQLVLVSPYEFHKNRVNTDEVRQIIEDVIHRQHNVRLTVQCLTRAELAAMPAAMPSSGATAAPSPAPAQPAPPVQQAEPDVARPTSPAPTTPPPPAHGNGNDNGSNDKLDPIEAIKNIFDAEEDRD